MENLSTNDIKQLNKFTVNIQFKPSFIGGVVILICMPLFIHLGNWQYDKAMQKQALQSSFDASLNAPPIALPLALKSYEALRYKTVQVQGSFEPKYGFLLDNMMYQERAGYHVITPMRLKNSNLVVLVNRGWVAAQDSHAQIPFIQTPRGLQTITAKVILPSHKFFSLEAPTDSTNILFWPTVWQNLDMKKFAKASGIEVMPIILRLEPNSEGGGFIREWPAPVEDITKNIGYAYQWYGFAVAAFAIFLFVSIKRKKV